MADPQKTQTHPAFDFLIRDPSGSFFHSGDMIGNSAVPAAPTPPTPPPLPRVTESQRLAALQKVLKDLSTRVQSKSNGKSNTANRRPQSKVALPREVPSEVPKKPEISAPDRLDRINRIVERLLAETHTILANDRQKSRLRDAVDAALHDRMNQTAFVEFLTRGEKIGGAGIDPEMAIAMSRIVSEERGSQKQLRPVSQTAPAPADQSALVEEIRKIQRGQRKLPQGNVMKAGEQAVRLATPIQKVAPPPPPATTPIRIRRLESEDTDAVKIQDIRSPRALIGPIEELRILTLTDFRRLGANLEEIHEKVKDKFDLLREESLTKLAEGIAAWKQSEVYRTYIDIGVESMNGGKSIHEIILERSTSNKPYLTQEEFDCVARVNRALMS